MLRCVEMCQEVVAWAMPPVMSWLVVGLEKLHLKGVEILEDAAGELTF
jgi:hypothetical protein